MEASLATLQVQEALDIKAEDVHYYTDSRVVLGYLSNSEKQFSRYVARRIELINNASGSKQWRYVSSENNPSDLACRPKKIEVISSKFRLKGPDFLREPDYQATEVMSPDLEDNPLPEEKEFEVVVMSTVKEDEDTILSTVIDRCDGLPKLQGIIRKVLHVLHLFEKTRQRRGVFLAPRASEAHVDDSLVSHMLLKDCQNSLKVADYQNLSPYMDDAGIYRVGALVPAKSSLARLLISHFHNKSLHQGRTVTHTSLRYSGFYIPGVRRLIDNFIRSCVTCRRLRGKPVMPMMADLLIERRFNGSNAGSN